MLNTILFHKNCTWVNFFVKLKKRQDGILLVLSVKNLLIMPINPSCL